MSVYPQAMYTGHPQLKSFSMIVTSGVSLGASGRLLQGRPLLLLHSGLFLLPRRSTALFVLPGESRQTLPVLLWIPSAGTAFFANSNMSSPKFLRTRCLIRGINLIYTQGEHTRAATVGYFLSGPGPSLPQRTSARTNSDMGLRKR